MFLILITKNTGKNDHSRSGMSVSSGEPPRTRLLREGLRAAGMGSFADRFTPDMLEQTQDGKPFFPGPGMVRFSLSHSGEYIACAFSDSEAGLDLQEHSRPHTSALRIAKRFFTAREYEALAALPEDPEAESPGNSASRLPVFYRFWSIKEAYLKYLGCGLRGGMDGYLPDPLPDSRQTPDLLQATASTARLCPRTGDFSRAQLLSEGSGKSSDPTDIVQRGRIRILKDDPLLTPADYALIKAPEGYAIAVCAKTLPQIIKIKMI